MIEAITSGKPYGDVAAGIAAKGLQPIPTFTIQTRVDPPPTKYQPKEGDVIERGRERWVVRWHAEACGGEMYVTGYRRGWFDKVWREWNRTTYMPSELAAMVNHMGWRLLP